MPQIFIISDGTGRTARQAVKAALTQFEQTDVELHVHSHLRSDKQIAKIIKRAAVSQGFIVHTVVSTDLRNKILHLGRLNNVATIDMMGPLLGQLEHQFANSPSQKPGLFHKLNKSYFQRIEAVEFTLRHDDGQKVEEIDKAEIVLLGVSRTFKTPISIYLAFKGWHVANIPIILDLAPAENIFSLQPERVFGLTTTPAELAVLRKVRDSHLGGAAGNYANLGHVKNELDFATSIYRKQPRWHVIDVTNKPIEEIASEILSVMRKKTTDSEGR